MIRSLFVFCILLLPLTLLGQYKVLGIGNICMDYIQPVDESFLQRLAISKGGWKDCDGHTFNQMLALAEKFKPPVLVSGGSACNTMKGLAALGVSTSITGNIGRDQAGERVLEIVQKSGVHPLCTRSNMATCQVASLVTADGERAFCVYNEAEKEISAVHLKKSFFENVDLVHVEGYRLMNDTYVESAMKMAKEAGALISFDLCNPVYCEKFRERIYGVLNEYVDVVFLDRAEAFALTHLDPEKACHFLKNYCNLTVIKVGADGCWVGCNGNVTLYPAIPTQMVDATGAGDLFASGFLYGMLKKVPLSTCAQYGHILASSVIQHYGAEIPTDQWPSIREKIAACPLP